jgi:hypothetical protein
MTASFSPLFADEVVRCMGEGRDPSIQELGRVAERIWTDGGANRSAFGWRHLSPASLARLSALRAAQLALCGVSESGA